MHTHRFVVGVVVGSVVDVLYINNYLINDNRINLKSNFGVDTNIKVNPKSHFGSLTAPTQASKPYGSHFESQ